MNHEDREATPAWGRGLLVLWVVIGTASALLLVLNLRSGGWDTGTASNVLMMVASVTGIVVERARSRPPR